MASSYVLQAFRIELWGCESYRTKIKLLRFLTTLKCTVDIVSGRVKKIKETDKLNNKYLWVIFLLIMN